MRMWLANCQLMIIRLQASITNAKNTPSQQRERHGVRDHRDEPNHSSRLNLNRRFPPAA